MESKEIMIPYFLHEAEQSKNERIIKRLTITVIIAIVVLLLNNIVWLYVWMQYDTVCYEQDGYGVNNVNLGLQRDVMNYGSESESQEAEGWTGEGRKTEKVNNGAFTDADGESD